MGNPWVSLGDASAPNEDKCFIPSYLLLFTCYFLLIQQALYNKSYAKYKVKMTTTIDIGTLIASTPGICGGRPRITGTRVSVRNIAIDYKAGKTPEEITEARYHLTLGQIYAALAYYHSNKEQIDTDIEAYILDCMRLEAQWMADKLK